MADPKVVEVLKQFSQKINSASLKERQLIWGDLLPCVVREDFPENGVKGVLKHLILTLGQYQDKKSRYAVNCVVSALAKHQFKAVNDNLATILAPFAEKQKTNSKCLLNSGSALNALDWTCTVIREGYKSAAEMKGKNFRKLVEIQSFLVYGALKAQRTPVTNGAYNKMRRIWKQTPGSLEAYVEALNDVDKSQDMCCIVGLLMKYLSSIKDQDTIAKYKTRYIEMYVKEVIGTKVKPERHLLETCKYMLKFVTHEEFKDVILPAVGRAMLRNPEIIFEGYCELLNSVTIDLSSYVQDLGKHLATQCHSKDDNVQDVAIQGCKYLAKQCSDSTAVEKLVKHFFGVLNGSEGKLSVVSQRMGLLSGIGNLSYNIVSGAATVQNLSGAVVEMFIPVLQQEVHEGTLVHCLSMFQLWCAKFNTQVPTKVVQWFKSGMALKSSTSAVRNSYIQCMNTAFNGDTLIQGTELIPVLLQTLDKASSQSTQVPLVTEALSAACLLIKLSLSDIEAEAKLAPFWSLVLDMEKQLFVSDKYVASAQENALCSLCTLTERLTLDHPQKLQEKASRQYYKGLVYALTHGTYSQRKHAQSSIKKMLSVLGGTKIAVSLINEFRNNILIKEKVLDYENIESDSPESSYIPPRVLYEAVNTLAVIPNIDAREAEIVALETLVDAHHPCIVYHCGDTWTDMLAKMKIDAGDFISNHAEDLVSKMMTDIKNCGVVSQSQNNAIQTLCRVSPSTVLPLIASQITSLLNTEGLANVTVNEYQIMQHPEGELYDQSVIESAGQQEANKNIKRENKLYSYAEQMAEVELQKEIERKKREKGLITKPKLTKKQQELRDAQLAKESDIRAKCKQLSEKVEISSSLIDACINGNRSSLRLYLPPLLSNLFGLMGSPLASPHMTRAYVELRQSALELVDVNLGYTIAYTTLRLVEPSCTLDPAWCDEPLQNMIHRVLLQFHQESVPPKGMWKREKLPASGFKKSRKQFVAPAFAYCFPLLKLILKGGGVAVKGDETLMCKALEIIAAHAQLREEGEDNTVTDERGPELLPREEMVRLCTTVVSTSSGKIQQLAIRALLETAQCASGEQGCAAATQEEIDALLDALQSPAAIVRECALMSLSSMDLMLPTVDADYENGLNVLRRLWIAKFDVNEDNRKISEKVMDSAGIEPCGDLCTLLVEDSVHNEAVVRDSAGEALAECLSENPDYTDVVVQQLLELYEEKLFLPPPEMDSLGRVITDAVTDMYPARCGIAKTIGHLSPHLTEEQVETVFGFFVEKGLGDRSEEVRRAMLQSAVVIVNDHGKNSINILLPMFEGFLQDAPNTASFDAIRQSIVILMGSLAKHLDKSDPKVKPIVGKLIDALSTPSQQVQEAVAACLPPLVPAIKDEAPGLVKKLLHLLLESDKFGERKGAAYGLAGLVKGLGILSLKQLDITATLETAVQNKKNATHREGALFAYEMLSKMLEKLFEPYVVRFIPHLLLCFGDGNQYVRMAADECAKAIMSQLSAHGVKQVLPSLLKGLEEDSWRTKTGSVELLGAMAYCAPKQLSNCLPSIVPKLAEVLTDSHLKVQKAGSDALKEIGSVIRNPEIQAIVPILLEALQDPTKKTITCLTTLLNTQFVHFIDAPSLALIMPVVKRSFQDRSTETRKMAAQIIGNMYSLTDQKDLSPYLPDVIPGLKMSLLDPVPEVRSVSARALGAMVKGMGKNVFDELSPWLMQTLISEQSSVDRSGAAQGLSEAIGGMGVEKLEQLMPDITNTASRENLAPNVRDGYIMMYIFLPTVFGDDFIPFVGPIIPSVLKALADENEYVRDTALKAGQRIINLYSDTAIELLLPQLEGGLFDDLWRIRYSSVQLLGDLLYRISGVTGKMTTEGADEDDNFGTENSQQAILRVLGLERRNRVLAGLYMGRSDTALLVRQSALHVWKVIVTHTPKMLKEILPTLFELLLKCLASTSYDKRQVAARTLGDLVRKLGEKVLPEIIPILEKGLESDEQDQRQGVCIGLSEIMSSTTRDSVIMFSESLVATVNKALLDPLPDVREAAAHTFDNLHANIGPRCLDEILPELLRQLEQDGPQAEYALDGLKQVIAVKSRVVLPYLVPHLTKKPVNTRALSILSSVAGEALNKHLSKILPALMSALSEKTGTDGEAEVLEHCKSVVVSVSDEAGVIVVMDELLSATSDKNSGVRCAAMAILHAYIEQSKVDFSEFVPQLFRGTIRLFTDSDTAVLNAAWDCLNAVIKKLSPSEMPGHISNIRQAVRYAVSDFNQELLPGFCLPKKGISPVLPIFREGILNGAQDLKESAAIGLGEVIKRTSADALKPSVVGITGPLIRILGDRWSYSVKVALLETLGLLLEKVGANLRPFIPQLQKTFFKALQDPNRGVRIKAATALGALVVIHTKVDPLFAELHTNIGTAEETAIKDTMLQALRFCILGAGPKMTDDVRGKVLKTLEELLSCAENSSRTTAAACLGTLCTCLKEHELRELLHMQLLDTNPGEEWTLRHGRGVALGLAIREAYDKLNTPDYSSKVQSAALTLCSSDRSDICLSGMRAMGYLMKHAVTNGENINQDIIQTLLKCFKHESNDVKSTGAQIISYVAKSRDEPLDLNFQKTIVPALVMGTKEKNTGVKSFSEYALVNLLKLRSGKENYDAVCSNLQPVMKDTLNEIYSKSMKKILAQVDNSDDEIDDTKLV